MTTLEKAKPWGTSELTAAYSDLMKRKLEDKTSGKQKLNNARGGDGWYEVTLDLIRHLCDDARKLLITKMVQWINSKNCIWPRTLFKFRRISLHFSLQLRNDIKRTKKSSIHRHGETARHGWSIGFLNGLRWRSLIFYFLYSALSSWFLLFF